MAMGGRIAVAVSASESLPPWRTRSLRERARAEEDRMRERAAAVGGILEIQSAPGEGTRLRARFPLATHI